MISSTNQQNIDDNDSGGGNYPNLTWSQRVSNYFLGLKANLISPALITPNLGTPSSGTLTNCTGLPTIGISDYNIEKYKMYAGLGSVVAAENMDLINILSTTALTSQLLYLHAIRIPVATTIAGVLFYIHTAGVYTANNNCKIGLYSYSAGTITLVASSNNDGNLWKGTSGNFTKKAFASAYPATAGVYYIGSLYCSSAQTQAPLLGSFTAALGVNAIALDFTNSSSLKLTLAGQTDLPASLALSTATMGTTLQYHGLYK